MSKRWLFASSVALIVFLVWLCRFQEDQQVRITFLGYEQDSPGFIRAHFEIRNLSDRTSLMVGQLPIQTNSNIGWRWSGKPIVLSDGIMGVPGIWHDTILAPSNHTTWRVAVISRRLSTYQVVERLSWLVDPKWRPARIKSGMWGSVCFSDPIPPQVEPYLRYKPPERKPEPPSKWE